MNESRLPPPSALPETAPFWSAARQGRLMLKHCDACGQPHFYPRAHCPLCGSRDTRWIEASGDGEIHTFTIVRNAVKPMAVAVITLAEGLSLVSIVIDSDVHDLRIGDPVRLRVQHAEGKPPVIAFATRPRTAAALPSPSQPDPMP